MSEKRQVGALLVEAGIITAKTLERALARQKGSGRRLGTVLEEMGVITDDELSEALAKQLDLKSVKNILGYDFSEPLLARVPVDMALQRVVFPLKEQDGILALAVSDPFDSDTFEFLAKKNGLKILPVMAPFREILAAIKAYYLHGGDATRNKRKILLAEDSPPVAAIIQAALQREGFDVTIANDGLEGLKQALTLLPDLIICDAVMPKMDGYGLLRALKGSPLTAEIPVILLTSKATPADEQRALETGFFDFVAKPVMPVRVVSRVKRALQLLEKKPSYS
jgi:CheY-like chemotaxis protein